MSVCCHRKNCCWRSLKLSWGIKEKVIPCNCFICVKIKSLQTELSSKVINSNFSTTTWKKWGPFSGITLPFLQTAGLTVCFCILPPQPAPALPQQGWRTGQAFCSSKLCYWYHKPSKSINTPFRRSLYGQCSVSHSYCWPRIWIGDLPGDVRGDRPVPEALMLVCLWKSSFLCAAVPSALDTPFKV